MPLQLNKVLFRRDVVRRKWGWKGEAYEKNIYAAFPFSCLTHMLFAVIKTQATHDCRLDSKN